MTDYVSTFRAEPPYCFVCKKKFKRQCSHKSQGDSTNPIARGGYVRIDFMVCTVHAEVTARGGICDDCFEDRKEFFQWAKFMG